MGNKPISASYAQMLANEEAKHAAEQKALREEFENVLKEEWSAEDIKEKLAELMPTAYASLKDLIMTAESESVRAALIKYVFDSGIKLAQGEGDGVDDELKTLLKELAKN